MAYKGSFNVRITPELHKKAAIYALTHQISLNRLMEDSVRAYLAALS